MTGRRGAVRRLSTRPPGSRHRSRSAPSRSGVSGGTVSRGRTRRRGCWTLRRGRRRGRLRGCGVGLLLPACALIRRVGRYLNSIGAVCGSSCALRAWGGTRGLACWNHRLVTSGLEGGGRWLMTELPGGRPSGLVTVRAGRSAYRCSLRGITSGHWASPLRCRARTRLSGSRRR